MLHGLALIVLIILALLLVVIGCSVFRWHPFPVLLVVSLGLGIGVGLPAPKTLQIMLEGGGSVFTAIGLIIALGTILGTVLEKTGAASALAALMVRKAGRKRLIPGVSLLGALVGIPVFCDSGFVILSNLARSLSLQSGLSFGAISIALATGLYTTHVLIPPTPGPMAAAGNLGVTDQLGLIILLGIVISIPALWVGQVMAKRFRSDGQAMENDILPSGEEPAPAQWRALVPLLLPVVLIAAGSMLRLPSMPQTSPGVIAFICNPNIALLLAVLAALLLLAPHRDQRSQWSGWIQHSLSQAGPIILITVTGGALGAVLKATPLSEEFGNWVQTHAFSGIWLYPLSFALAAGLKSSQGSSTAALVIASSIMSSLLPASVLVEPAEKALLVLSIGAGAMTVSHSNDSYFWVISQYAGIPPNDMYRHFTLTTFFMGLASLATCMILAGLI